jgi:DNA-binding transcriptional LysR family regulator
MGVLSDSALTARKLAQADRPVVASPSYFARKGVPSNPAELQEHSAIIHRQAAGGNEWLFQCGTSEVLVRLQARLTLSAAETVREAVLSGQGFAIASRWMFAPELASGEVVSVLKDWNLPRMDLWVIYPSGRLTSTKARAFVKWFETTLGEANAIALSA